MTGSIVSFRCHGSNTTGGRAASATLCISATLWTSAILWSVRYTADVNDWTGKRKRIKHQNLPGVAHELTWSCYHMRPLLNTPERRTLLTDAMRRAAERLGYAALAFVVMPNHVHLLVRHSDPEYDVSELLYAIKRPTSFRFKQIMLATDHAEYESLIVQERPGKLAFRFWQEGPGYDRNCINDIINSSVRYIHLNPVRKGLCEVAEDWEWSSARWYAREAVRPDGGIEWNACDERRGS